MKNVTITLDKKVATWARQQAARHAMSLSRYVGALLERTMRESREYERAMRGYLARPASPLKSRGSRYPNRAERHELSGLR